MLNKHSMGDNFQLGTTLALSFIYLFWLLDNPTSQILSTCRLVWLANLLAYSNFVKSAHSASTRQHMHSFRVWLVVI